MKEMKEEEKFQVFLSPPKPWMFLKKW